MSAILIIVLALTVNLLPPDVKEFSVEIGGKKLTAQFSDLAERANGSVILKYGNTTVLATAVMSTKEKEGMNWFPLTVDYEEKFYAAGKILGSRYMRREGRPSDDAVLAGRIVDRTIRPLFDQSMRRDIQVVVMVLAIDDEDPDVLAVNAASLALATSNIPWAGPVSAVRITNNISDNILVTNATFKQRDEEGTNLELVACGKDSNINMIEVASDQIDNELTHKAFVKASEEIEKIQEFQKMIISEIGKEKVVIDKKELGAEEIELFNKEIKPKLDAAVFAGAGNDTIYTLEDSWKKLFKETFPEGNMQLAGDYVEEAVNDLLHNEAIDNNRRADGRSMDKVRKLYCQAGGISEVLHGSGIFYRGGTHILSALTLGGPGDAQLIEGIETSGDKYFMHHYNFPPFSVGECGRMGGMNRRMIGHGALAEKALVPTLPSREDFPYTIRIVSESTASNGSTSMASVCGSTLALMDAGVPIKAPAAGIAMGLMMRDEKNYKVLTDIQGPEDHHGDMDFKVAGTRNGITAIQMDIKVDGIPVFMLKEALADAETARLHILDEIEAEIAKPRDDISNKAPKILTITIKTDQIGLVIGPGGKQVKEIREKTGADIDIEDDGTVFITGSDGAAEEARAIIEAITKEYKVGESYKGKVTKIFDFGALVEFAPKTDGLLHISEIAPFRLEKVEDVVKLGDVVPVIITKVDKGKIGLSIKQLDPDFAKNKGVTAPKNNNYGGGDNKQFKSTKR